MHVVLLPSWYPKDATDIGGSFFREQALALHRSGCRVGVVTPQFDSLRALSLGSLFSPRLTTEVDAGVITVRRHAVNWTPRLRDVIRRRWTRIGEEAFEAYQSAHGVPDVLHVHSVLDAGVLARRLSARFRIPYVLTEHSTAFARGQLPADELRLASDIAQFASCRIAVSPQLADLLVRTLDVGSGDWVTVPNIVDASFFSTPLRSIRQGAFTFINVALMDYKKGQDILLQAFAIARRDEPLMALIIVGDGEEEPRLRQLAQSLGIDGGVTFAGRLSRAAVRERVAAADGFVLSSRVETFGVVVAEALALGKPVVATRCGGPESIVRDDDGELVPVGDIEALARAMVRVAKGRDRFDPSALREGCRARFGEDAVIRAIRDCYAAVVGRAMLPGTASAREVGA